MDSITILFTLLPAALVVLAVILARRAGPPEQAAGRVLLLLESITLLALVMLAILPYLMVNGSFIDQANRFCVPVLFGTLVVILIHLPQIGRVQRRLRLVLIGMGLGILALVVYFLRDSSAYMLALPAVAASLFAAWLISTRPARWVWLLPVIVALLWIFFNAYLNGNLDPVSLKWPFSMGLLMLSAPLLSVAVIAFFVDSGLGLLLNPSSESNDTALRLARVEGLLRLLAAALVLGMTIYTAVWSSIWDQTSDGLGGLFIAEIVMVMSLACAMVIGLRKTGWARLAGLAFFGVTTCSVYVGFMAGWQISFPDLTKQRGAQIGQALERFYQREARYPQSLAELSPRDLLLVPGPVMFHGEDWCYQASGSAYRLAAFTHEYFSLPVSLDVYASAGEWGERPLPCYERLAEMQQRYDWTGGWQRDSAAPTPQP